MKKKLSKKIFIIVLLVLAVLATYTYVNFGMHKSERELACFDALASKLDKGANPKDIANEDLDELQFLVEYSLVARMRMLEVAERLSPGISTIFSKSFHWLAALYAVFEPYGTCRVQIVVFTPVNT